MPLPTETLKPYVAAAPGEPTGWWPRLRNRLTGISETSLEALDADSTLVAGHVAPRKDGVPDPTAWPASRLRTGIVVGSVQSGKTASMLAVAAKVLDRGVAIVVVLSGTKVALWLQTYGRLLSQLDGSSPATAYRRDRARVLVPSPYDVQGADVRLDARHYIKAHGTSVTDAVRKGLPVIFVVPKEDDHLAELAKLLRTSLAAAFAAGGTAPVEMVVFDDEADDASVLSSESLDKVTPVLIQRLWSGMATPTETLHERLFATYVAYTATPQANLVQQSHNPLSPRHFGAALRTPGPTGSLEPRELTYREPKGIRAFYTGGRFFYEPAFSDAGFCQPLPFPERQLGESEASYGGRLDAHWHDALGEALRAYLVAGAVRLLLAGKKLSDVSPEHEAKHWPAVAPPVHTMLIHPSVKKDAHFEVARQVHRWSRHLPPQAPQDPLDVVPERLDAPGLASRLDAEDDRWRTWLERYRASAKILEYCPGAHGSGLETVTWSAVRTVLLNEVFPHTKLKVLNSDEDASGRPSFEVAPVEGKPGKVAPPGDIFTIFVAGNVLSRGLTLEGLTTSVFVRPSTSPVADTQMQMQRWLGYRGGHLAFCRVFLYSDQLRLFRDYHFDDESLKRDILSRTKPGSILSAADGFFVLEGPGYRATAKVANVRQVPLHPGPTPFVRLVEHQNEALVKDNIGLVADLLSSKTWTALNAAGKRRGLICPEPVELSDVADILDRLRYGHHVPDLKDPMYKRWAELQETWSLAPLLKLPDGNDHPVSAPPTGCPYSIAAYLRLWSQLLNHQTAQAFVPTDRPTTRWHLLNLSEYQATRPRFYLGIRDGGGRDAKDPRLNAKGIKVMVRQHSAGLLDASWGSRGTHGDYFGDQLFDYHLHGTAGMPYIHGESLWRPRGHPGLLLLHVVQDAATDRDMVAVGLALPRGGPDHIAALPGARGDQGA
ncbi:MAG: Z1 domain-containing protein [Myxococcales bacterium]